MILKLVVGQKDKGPLQISRFGAFREYLCAQVLVHLRIIYQQVDTLSDIKAALLRKRKTDMYSEKSLAPKESCNRLLEWVTRGRLKFWCI